MSRSGTPTLAESPWFWVHAFSVFTLIVLILFSKKIEVLTATRTRNDAMRRSVYGGPASAEPLPGGDREDDGAPAARGDWLLPSFYLLFGIAAIVSWVQVWRTVLRYRFADRTEPSRRAGRRTADGSRPGRHHDRSSSPE